MPFLRSSLCVLHAVYGCDSSILITIKVRLSLVVVNSDHPIFSHPFITMIINHDTYYGHIIKKRWIERKECGCISIFVDLFSHYLCKGICTMFFNFLRTNILFHYRVYQQWQSIFFFSPPHTRELLTTDVLSKKVTRDDWR
jgi:hypothetical protein